LKKIAIVLPSVIITLALVLYFNEWIKGLVAASVLSIQTEYLFKGVILYAVIPLTNDHSFLTYAYIFSVPLLMSFIFIEGSAFALKKTINTNLRTGLVIFQLVNIGFILVNIFIAILSVILKNTFQSGWSQLLEFSGYSYPKQLVFMLFLVLLLFAYINYSSNRLRRYITVLRDK
jgi:hypothetical protein